MDVLTVDNIKRFINYGQIFYKYLCMSQAAYYKKNKIHFLRFH
jgi:hypothetical protein